MFYPENKSLFSEVSWYFPPKQVVSYKSIIKHINRSISGFDSSFDPKCKPNATGA
jgi:hypothetical protein